MKILFVLNNFYSTGNGLAASARRTVAALREAGEEVRVLSGPNHEAGGPQPEYLLKDFYFPLFQPIISAHGYMFASTDTRVVEEAVRWADVVHMQEPFVLEIRTAKIAKRLGKPITGTYHLHPENVFFSLWMGAWKLPNKLLLNAWRDLCFNKWSYVQCPTQNVKERLEANGFTSNLRVISNGVVPDPSVRQAHQNRPFRLACIGRLSGEKDQFTLLEAMRHCAHAQDIQLIFAGRGPQENRIRRKARRLFEEGVLSYDPVFVFLDRDGLRRLAASSDLAIHCATVEVEGLSIMEAIQQGAVPIIARGPITGTDQFALNERSCFPQKDATALAGKIDWWLDHPDRLEAARDAYVEFIKTFNIDNSVRELIKMFRDASRQ
ncbi:MAG: glycosyltransferase [Bacteroidales bacterium]|nr:glycosyltransferase [Bacteroidales bacterium]